MPVLTASPAARHDFNGPAAEQRAARDRDAAAVDDLVADRRSAGGGAGADDLPAAEEDRRAGRQLPEPICSIPCAPQSMVGK